MTLSVIIPTFHRNDLLSKCLEKLSPGNQTLASVHYEVIVTDDGKETTAEQLIKEKFNWARWIKGPQKGPAANRNKAASLAEGDWLVFTDDDCLPDVQWLESYHNAIHTYSENMVFEGKTYPGCPQKSFSECAPVNEKGGFFPSCNFLIKKEVFDKLNGFDEDYAFSFEDMDMHYRIEEKKYEIIFLENASVCHPWRKLSLAKTKIFYRKQLKGIFCFLSKHPRAIKTFNSKHFLLTFISSLFFYFIPGLLKYRGKGIFHGFYYVMFKIKLAFLLLPKTFHWYYGKPKNMISSELNNI